MQKITPCLWFDNQAEDAVSFYTSIFDDSRVLDVARYGEGGPGPPGSVMTIRFQLHGLEFIALNGGPEFKFTEAISLSVDCKSQEEVDRLWDKLGEGGEIQQCGWLKDKYGLSWQVVPTVLVEMLQDDDAERARRVMNAMLQMKKIEIKDLQRAYQGG